MALALAEVVANLRAELNEAVQASAEEDLLFEIGPVELELTVGVDNRHRGRVGRRSRDEKPGRPVVPAGVLR
jgi:hypothetical protein